MVFKEVICTRVYRYTVAQLRDKVSGVFITISACIDKSVKLQDQPCKSNAGSALVVRRLAVCSK